MRSLGRFLPSSFFLKALQAVEIFHAWSERWGILIRDSYQLSFLSFLHMFSFGWTGAETIGHLLIWQRRWTRLLAAALFLLMTAGIFHDAQYQRIAQKDHQSVGAGKVLFAKATFTCAFLSSFCAVEYGGLKVIETFIKARQTHAKHIQFMSIQKMCNRRRK